MPERGLFCPQNRCDNLRGRDFEYGFLPLVEGFEPVVFAAAQKHRDVQSDLQARAVQATESLNERPAVRSPAAALRPATGRVGRSVRILTGERGSFIGYS